MPDPIQFSIERLFAAVRRAIPSDIHVREVRAIAYGGGTRSRLKVLCQMWREGRRPADVFHVTGDIHFAVLALPGRRTVLTIHDLTTLSALTGWSRAVFMLMWILLPVWRSSVVTVVAESVRSDLVRLLPWARRKIVVIPNCNVSDFPVSPKVFNHSCPTVLLIGTAWNKNLPKVVRSLRTVRCKLRIVGRMPEDLREECNRSGLEFSSVHDLDDAGVRREYEQCDMLVFASLHEGFGLPILEAQSVGRVVVTSNRAPMSDVAGGAAVLVDPDSESSIREGVERVIQDAELRESLIARGFENASSYSPGRTAERYAQVYRTIARGQCPAS